MACHGYVGIVLLLCFQSGASQVWSWIGGAYSVGAWSTDEHPGARSGSSIWRDSNGVVWLFGGMGFSDLAKGHAQVLNDLWSYDTNRGEWKLIHPGTRTTKASDNHAPSPRQLASSCGVTGVTLVVFGGLDENDQGVEDTWVYYMDKQRWLALSEMENYTAETQNLSIVMPTARGDNVNWCLADSLYIFGGLDNSNIFNDMWKFSLKNLKWSEVKAKQPDSNNTYPSGRNGATTWVTHNDNGAVLYMYGGNTKETNIRNRHMNVGYSSDMWRYLVESNKWEYLRGGQDSCQNAKYGMKGDMSKESHPGCIRQAAGWTDTDMNLWMYGGDGTDEEYPSVFHSTKLLSDLWFFNVEDNVWTWYGSSDRMDKTIASPGGRYEANHWIGGRNKFFLMGGLGHDQHEYDGYLNDVWVLDMDEFVNAHGVPDSLVVLYLMLAVTLVLVMTGLYLYARDRRGSSIWSRFDQNVKYSQLTTVAD